ncbi:uncharacterized protein TRIADDRAFT_60414 [Trichoplax adhaerens]|uniref:Uncharacterized protein n=1 Tax=Trichoplax adhaerens TaxID=10228 RepID=B3S856_TRIAD|nr:predicted protein [Trichoplax adhaerens]EDV21139.1 predicted protein [Trichoplax adhaerens]|eukprot:XP_002116469.1 predicted protein [Trichoplax adhaerens]
MTRGQTLGAILIISAIAIIASALATIFLTPYLINIRAGPVIFDPTWSAVLAVVLAAVLFKVKDSDSPTQTEASALLSLGIVGVVLSPANITRLFCILFGGGYNQPRWYLPMTFEIAGTAVFGIVSLIVAIQQGKRIQNRGSISQSYAVSGINRFTLSIIMVILGIIVFGLAVAILQERWYRFSVISIHFHGVMLFATGVIGLIAHDKDIAELNVWHKTMAIFSSCVSGAAMIVLVQTMVHYTNSFKFSMWERADFTVLALTQSVMTIIGAVTTVIASHSSQYPNDVVVTPTKINSENTSRNINNIGLMASGLLAGGIAIFMMAAMGFASYGYISLIVGCMAYTASRIGIASNYSATDSLNLAYFATNLFIFLQAICAVALIVFMFIIRPFSSSPIIGVSIIFDYVFMGISIVSMIPPFIFAARAAFSRSLSTQERLISDDGMEA